MNYFTKVAGYPIWGGELRWAAWHDGRMTPQDLFRLHSFFGALTDGEMQELLKRALTKRVAAGEVLFRKDDPGNGLYGVLTGSILMVVESLEGKELILNMPGPGGVFGEVSLLAAEVAAAPGR